jgi:multicomponent Na+:H+ antiporter subunit D
MIHVIAAKSALFFATGLVRRLAGSTELKRLGGLYRRQPLVAALFFLPALALAGIPPLSGFWAKLALVRVGLESGHYIVVASALLVSLFTLFSMTKIWSEAFWKDRPAGTERGTRVATALPQNSFWLMAAPTGLLGLTTVVMGLFPEPLYALCLTAAGQLLQPGAYIAAVLGGIP